MLVVEFSVFSQKVGISRIYRASQILWLLGWVVTIKGTENPSSSHYGGTSQFRVVMAFLYIFLADTSFSSLKVKDNKSFSELTCLSKSDTAREAGYCGWGMLWCRFRLYPPKLSRSQQGLLEGNWLIRTLYPSVRRSTDESVVECAVGAGFWSKEVVH